MPKNKKTKVKRPSPKLLGTGTARKAAKATIKRRQTLEDILKKM